MMTPQEIVEMGERIKLIQLLLQGKTQREVAAQL
jgi:Trp operon repressor